MNRTLRQILALIRLDLKLFFSDRRALIMLFGVPIGVASFMGYVFSGGGGKSGPTGLNLVLVDQDNSAVSRGVISNFAGDATFRVTITNEATARTLVLNGKQPVALVLPAGLGDNVLAGLFQTNRKPVITLLHDPSHSMERAMVAGMLIPKVIQSVAQNTLTFERGREFLRDGLTNISRATNLSASNQRLYRELMERQLELLATRTNSSLFGGGTPGTNGSQNDFALPMPFLTRNEALTKSRQGEYNGYAHSFGGMSLQFVLMSMLESAVGLLRERESGMFRRLRSAPLARGTLLLGKGLSFAIIALLSLSGCFTFAMAVFGVRVEGSWVGFIGCLVLTALMSAGFALMIAGLGKTPAGTRGIGIAVTLLLVMVGGAWVPAFVFPLWLQKISLATPTRWAVDGFDAMTWRGLGLDAALPTLGVLTLFAGAFALIAWLRFRWNAE